MHARPEIFSSFERDDKAKKKKKSNNRCIFMSQRKEIANIGSQPEDTTSAKYAFGSLEYIGMIPFLQNWSGLQISNCI